MVDRCFAFELETLNIISVLMYVKLRECPSISGTVITHLVLLIDLNL